MLMILIFIEPTEPTQGEAVLKSKEELRAAHREAALAAVGTPFPLFSSKKSYLVSYSIEGHASEARRAFESSSSSADRTSSCELVKRPDGGSPETDCRSL